MVILVELDNGGLGLVSDLAVRIELFSFLAALLLLLMVGELARLACTGVGSCSTVEVRCSSACFS